MNPDETLSRCGKTLVRWRERLDRYDDERFAASPAPGTWSPAQVFEHVIGAAGLILSQVEECARGEGERRRTSFKAGVILLLGSIPPIRVAISTPPPGLTKIFRPDAIERGEAAAGLDWITERMASLRGVAADAEPGLRRPHFALGFMNARQWYAFQEMHLRHHLRQLARLDRWWDGRG